MSRPNTVLPISEQSQVAEARRAAVALARRCGLSETEAGKVAIVASELATNLLKHAGGGDLLLGSANGQPPNGSCGLEIISIDRGQGIGNLGEALRDGFSTAGSAGTGLGAVRRLSTGFDIYSQPGRGTVVFARIDPHGARRTSAAGGMTVGAVSVASPCEVECGDQWAMLQRAHVRSLMLADGLGHGASAAMAARTAMEAFEQNGTLAPAALLERAHQALRSTRGAACAVADVDLETGVVRYCGVGNIATSILDQSGQRHLVSHNGTVGHVLRKVKEFTYPWKRAARQPLPLLIMHSDGLSAHWNLEQYPGLAVRHPGLVAAVLYRDFKRGRDDVTVLVAKEAVE